MRARNIKPAFFKDVELSECSFEARLLFQGYWCLADRLGLLIFSPKFIKAEVFPYDDVDVVKATNELLSVGVIVAYIHTSLTIISVRNFTKHQRPHTNEEASTLPQPDEKSTLVTKVESASYQGAKRFALNEESLMRNDDTLLPNTENVTETKPTTKVKRNAKPLITLEQHLGEGESQPNGWEYGSDGEWRKFCDYYIFKQTKGADWKRAWQGWLRRSAERKTPQQYGANPAVSKYVAVGSAVLAGRMGKDGVDGSTSASVFGLKDPFEGTDGGTVSPMEASNERRG